jgi:hypothetical protein
VWCGAGALARQLLAARKRPEVSILKVSARIQSVGIRVDPWQKALYPRRLYNTANSNPAFAGNSSATFLSRSASAEGASSG